MKQALHKSSHSVYAIYLHLYFVTKYRRKMLTTPILERIEQVVQGICRRHKSELLEFGAEPDHVHLLIDLHPDNNISQLVRSMKSSTSRVVQSEFSEYYASFYRKTALWGRQKFMVSCGGAPLEIVKQYVKGQAGTDT